MKLSNRKMSRRFVVGATTVSAVSVRGSTGAQPRAVALTGDRAHNPELQKRSVRWLLKDLQLMERFAPIFVTDLFAKRLIDEALAFRPG